MECMPTFWESADIAPETRLLRAAKTRAIDSGARINVWGNSLDVPRVFSGLAPCREALACFHFHDSKVCWPIYGRMNTPTVTKKNTARCYPTVRTPPIGGRQIMYGTDEVA